MKEEGSLIMENMHIMQTLGTICTINYDSYTEKEVH